MSNQKFCEQCGASLREGGRFCESCGSPVGIGVKETPVTVPPSSSAPPVVTAPRAEAIERGHKCSPKLLLMTLAGIVLVSMVGMGGWWFGSHKQNQQTSSQAALPVPTTPPAAPAPSAPAPALPGLVAMGDFSQGSPPGMEGDGNRSGDGENPSWQMQGPDDMAIDIPLKPTPGRGSIAVSCRVLIPVATTTDSQLGGVRIRFRFTDRYESSGVADQVLQASDDWQTVGHTFEDTGSGPYRLGIEAFGFSGLLYLDNVDARITGDRMTASSPMSTAAGVAVGDADSVSPTVAAEASKLENWVVNQPWFQRLSTSMPDGVTLSIMETDGGFEGWTPFEIREHHSAESGFDPDVAPLVGRFEVSPKRDEVGWYDAVSDEWQPIADFIASRGL